MLKIVALALVGALACGAEIPRVTGGQLLVDGKPYLVLGGELGNSSAGTAAQADTVLPRVAKLHVNTVLMPVAWEQTEPVEGQFDFGILDHWIDVARAQHVRLVLLWFGAWKNAFSNYTPGWVKADTRRFPRAVGPDGRQLEILSTTSAETLRCDSRAFAALMRHVRAKDAAEQTVLMVQVENEVGYLGEGGRDRSAEATALFDGAVPADLRRGLEGRRGVLQPEMARHFNADGRTWREVFGEAADEVFTSWQYATYIQAVAAAGKREYALPMYANTQLPAPGERAGEYPSGGPYPYVLDVYRVGAPALDFLSPDIYWPDFAYWIRRYEFPGNAVFVPEARLEAGPFNALYAYGAARAFGFSPFGIDSLTPPAAAGDAEPLMMQVDGALESQRDLLPGAEKAGKTRGLVLHANSPRPAQTVALGGYLWTAALSRSWPAKALLEDDGAMLVVQTAPDEFLVTGMGLTVSFMRDPDTDAKVAGIASIEEGRREGGVWVTERRLNGDQSNQGRELAMDAKRVRMYRVRLYAVGR